MSGVRRSVFDVRCSVLGVRRSAFGVRCSVFGVRGQEITVPLLTKEGCPTGGVVLHHSEFNIQYSTRNIQSQSYEITLYFYIAHFTVDY